MRFTLLFLYFLSSILFNYAQNNDLDLKQAVELYDSAKKLLARDPQKSIAIFRKLENTPALKLVVAESQKWLDIAIAFKKTGKLDSSKYFLKKGIQFSKADKDTFGQVRILNGLGVVFRKLNQLDSSEAAFNKTIILSKSLEDSVTLAKAYNNRALLYRDQLRFNEALNDFQESLKIKKLLNDEIGQAIANGNIGLVLSTLNEYKSSIVYLRKSLFYLNKRGIDAYSAIAASNLSESFLNLNSYDSAAYYAKFALKKRKKIGDPAGLSKTYNALAKLEIQRGEYSSAERYYRKIDSILAITNLADEKSLNYLARSKLLYKQNKLDTALIFAERAYLIADSIKKNLIAIQAAEHLSGLLAENGNFKKAYELEQKIKELRNASLDEKVAEAVSEITADYEKSKREAEKALEESYETVSQLETSERNWKLIVFISLSILLLLFVLFLANSLRLKRKTNRALSRKNKELDSALERAKVASKVKSDFLATVSHEIRTPLNGIIGMTQVIMQNQKSNDPDKGNITAIWKSARNLLSLLNDVLEMSRLESGKISIEYLEFNPEGLAKEVINHFKPQANQKNIELTYKIDGEIPDKVLADENKCRQVIINLLSNAIKFTDDGYVNLKLSYSETKNLDTNRLLTISVQDSGIGMAPEESARIFESFTQANKSTSRLYGGIGLGLSISKKLVEAMKGELKVESVQGKGSNFWFSIPVLNADKPGESDEGSIKTAPLSFSGNGLSALIVEDNQINQIVLSKLLNNLKIRNEISNNGKEALEKLHKNEFDFVFMDIEMPVMDGEEAIRIIRDEEGLKNQRVIAITANTQSGMKEHYLKLGFDDFISKPFIVDDLLSVITNKKAIKH